MPKRVKFIIPRGVNAIPRVLERVYQAYADRYLQTYPFGDQAIVSIASTQLPKAAPGVSLCDMLLRKMRDQVLKGPFDREPKSPRTATPVDKVYRGRVLVMEQPSAWSLSIVREGDRVSLGMHFGDKSEATHCRVLSYDEWKKLVADIG